MINKTRLKDFFINILKINSPSKDEKEISEFLKKKLNELGFEIWEDNAAEIIEGTTNNLYGLKKGNPNYKSICLNAHMDTVMPTENINIIEENGIIKTDETTILGADDKAGIAIIIEGIEAYLNSNKEHGDIYVLFTVSEETGVDGASVVTNEKLKANFTYSFDTGSPACSLVTSAPTHNTMTYKIYGVASHAGMSPELGVNAILTASKAIANMKLGKINNKTTANVGKICGGERRNIVPNYCEVLAEARSRDENMLNEQVAHMTKCFEDACKETGARLEIDMVCEYKAFTISEKEEIFLLAKKTANDIGIDPKIELSCGGYDASLFNQHGIQSMVVGTGYENVHSPSEYIAVKDLEKASEFVFTLIENVTKL